MTTETDTPNDFTAPIMSGTEEQIEAAKEETLVEHEAAVDIVNVDTVPNTNNEHEEVSHPAGIIEGAPETTHEATVNITTTAEETQFEATAAVHEQHQPQFDPPAVEEDVVADTINHEHHIHAPEGPTDADTSAMIAEAGK